MDENPPQGHQSLNQKAQTLISIITDNSLSSSISKLSGSSRALPSDKDFHFYNNFDEFKKPIKEIDTNSKSSLEIIGSSSHIFGKKMTFPVDDDDAYDSLVSVNDETFERIDSSLDEFQRVRKTEETENNEFQLVCGKKKKALSNSMDIDVVKVASRDSRTIGGKQKVPFHIPTIPRPQNEFSILVNNAHTRFEHVWLPKSEDGSRFVHPLETLSVLDFVDCSIEDTELVRPPPVECSTFKLVEDVEALKQLAAKLRSVNEFAVDLEHNQYRSFQGLTCLMQISTRTEDFVVDTLKLRIHIGPYFREIFKDPTKKKVMHGADRDIEWLQRDFGIYICNLFDTGQASRVLKLERNSLEFLLRHFCGVTANKEYQNADWRLRPLPDEMLRYAREDTHYLLHIYDLLRVKLLTSNDTGNSDPPLVEVYKRSYDICMHLYEKDLLTETSYLHIYGMQEVDFTAEQLAIVAGLCEWRDSVARAEDESTGYILPNKVLLEMPVTASKLRRLLRSKHPYIDQNIGSVVNIIKHAIYNAAAFETVVEQLKKERLEMASQEAVEADGSELTSPQALTTMKALDVTSVTVNGDTTVNGTTLCAAKNSLENGSTTTEPHKDEKRVSSGHLGKTGVANEIESFIPGNQKESFSIPGQVTGATVQASKKPSRAFGALLGNSASKRKFDMGKEALKLEHIKSLVNLPFHSFTGEDEQLKQVVEKHTGAFRVEESLTDPASNSNLEDVILLKVDSAVEQESLGEDPKAQNATKSLEDNDDGDEPMSLSELSSSFKKCFPANHQTINKGRQQAQKKVEEPAGLSEVKPFDYEAAKLQVRFDGKAEKHSKLESNEKRKSSGGKKSSAQKKDEETGDFQQGRRRQAFPATGNRSATFR